MRRKRAKSPAKTAARSTRPKKKAGATPARPTSARRKSDNVPSTKSPKKPATKRAVKAVPGAQPSAPPAVRAAARRAFDAKSDSAYDPAWVPPVWDDDILLGAHVSIAGGTHHAPFRAGATGASAMQVFTKMANRWAERDCEDEECAEFRSALAATRVDQTMAHDSYLINLASPDPTLRRQSIDSFIAELRRCRALGLTCLVSHPGNYLDDRSSGVRRNAEGITEALERVPAETILCLETTAGSGTAIGASFEELAELIALIPEPHRSRVAVCADTCHLYSAGYDLVRDFDGVWARFDDTLGLGRLRVLHLNDSKTPFGSRRDRHELIGEGSLGDEPFRRIMNDGRFAAVPKILETPKLGDATATDTAMMRRLRGFVAGRRLSY